MREFVAMMAMLTSLVALSIDAMLPALPRVGADLGVSERNHYQLVVSVLFLGMAFGQLVYGPVSDSTDGRAGRPDPRQQGNERQHQLIAAANGNTVVEGAEQHEQPDE